MRADHFMGGNLQYKTIDSAQGIFEVTLMLERPCNASPLNSEYTISVLENYNGLYQKSVYVIKLKDSSYINLPCFNPANSCSNSNVQVIEQKYFKVNIIVQNSTKECIVFFQENFRTSSTNLANSDLPIFIYTAFIPSYVNSQIAHKELNRSIPLRNKLSKISYSISDLENDSLQIISSAPFTGISYTLNNSTLNPSFEKSMFQLGYSDLKPFAINESQLDIKSTAISFTPTIVQQNWLTLIKNEFRKLKISGKDTWVKIGSSNSDRLISVNDFNSQFHLNSISSTQSHVVINGQSVTICNQHDTAKIIVKFPIEKSLNQNQLKINFNGTEIPYSYIRINGTVIDTLLISVYYIHNSTIDLTSNLKFEFDLCHASSGLGFNKFFEFPMTIFNYKVFKEDTILTCASHVNISTLLSKTLTVNYGSYNSGTQTLSIISPHDTTIISTLSQSNAYCPFRDTLVINHGVEFTTNVIGYQPTCKGYSNAAAKVFVIGVNSPFTFRWTNFSTQDSIGSIEAGTHIVEIKDKDNCSQFDTIVINNPAGIDYNWELDTPITCAGGNNGRGHIEIISSLKPSQYLWNHNMSGDSFASNLSKGIYTGKYTYINDASINCIQNFNVDIKDSDSIKFKSITTDNKCFGDTFGKIAIIASGGQGVYTYSFDNINSTSGLKLNLATGNYSVYVVDSNNCKSSTQIISVNSPSKITYNLIKQNPSCVGVENGILGFQDIVGGKYPFTFSVNNSSYSGVVYYPSLAVNNYVLKVKDVNNCIVSQSTNLSPQYVLTAQLDSVVNSRCPKSNSGKIHLRITNGLTPYKTFLNQDSNLIYSTSLKYNDLPKGSHVIKIKDQNLCTWTSNYTISEPDTFRIIASTIDESCYQYHDGKINLLINTGGTVPYQNIGWKNSLNLPISSTSGLAPDIYTLSITDKNLCEFSKQFSIKAKDKFIVKIDTIQAIKCHNNSDGILRANIIGGTQPLVYKWNNNLSLNQSELTNLSAGSYALEVKDNENCITINSAILSNPIKINLEDLKIKNADCPSINNGGISLICSGGTSHTSALRFALKPSLDFQIHNSFTNLPHGNYMIVVKDDNDCKDSFVAEIKKDKSLEITLQDTIHCELGETILLNPILSFGANTNPIDIKSSTWNPQASISCTDCIKTEYTATQSGVYQLDIQYGNSCNTSAKIYFDVAKPQEIFIPNSFSPNGDLKNDQWQVFGKNIQSINIKLVNKVGELIFHTTDINKSWDGLYQGKKESINTYRYIIIATYIDGSIKKYEGMINLIR